MATVKTGFGYNAKTKTHAKYDKELQMIIREVQHYLQSFDRKRYFLSVTVRYHKRCCKSWAKVGFQLQRFLDSPKDQYSVLMVMLEREVEKFPRGSHYCKQLHKLIQLLEKGPTFSINSVKL